MSVKDFDTESWARIWTNLSSVEKGSQLTCQEKTGFCLNARNRKQEAIRVLTSLAVKFLPGSDEHPGLRTMNLRYNGSYRSGLAPCLCL